MNWETVVVDSGYYKWGEPGQTLTGKVISREIGKDSDNNPRPQLTIETLEPTVSIGKNSRIHVEASKVVTLTCSQANLKKSIIAAQPKPCDLLRIQFERWFPTPRGKAKIFEVQIARA